MSIETFVLTRGTESLQAILLSAPPVYAPGGPVCFIEEWQNDETLLSEAEQAAAGKGAVLTRVICPHGDHDRAAMLTQRGYTVASEWYTAALPLPRRMPHPAVRPLTAADVPRLLELGEAKRRQYEAYSLVFWRVSALPRETFAPYLQSQIENLEVIALAYEPDGMIDGFILANAQGSLDDFMVAAPELWPTVGAGLLSAAASTAHRQGISSLLVVCGQGDTALRAMLVEQGLSLTRDWYVRTLSEAV